jgi:Uma2 family endonuclease
MATVERDVRNPVTSGAALPISEAGEHRFTVDEYLRIADELGRVELIDGVIHDVSPQSDNHVDAVTTLFLLLRERYPDKRVRPGGSVHLGPGSLWEPDVIVANPRRIVTDDATYTAAADVHLVVEVAVTTRWKDVRLKLPGYARAGVPEYWLVDPKRGGTAQRHTGPEVSDDGSASYTEVTTVRLPGGLDDLADLWTRFEQAETDGTDR